MLNKSYSLYLNNKIKPFVNTIRVDSDKSLSIRSFLIGSISQNISTAKNVLESEDVVSTINLLEGIRKFSKKTLLIFASTNKVYGD